MNLGQISLIASVGSRTPIAELVLIAEGSKVDVICMGVMGVH